MPNPSVPNRLILTHVERALNAQLMRERAVITAMQRRQIRWLTPVGDFFWRKPWKAPTPPSIGRKPFEFGFQIGVKVNAYNFWQWFRYAHDCQDPSVGCSCSGGYRHPTPHP